MGCSGTGAGKGAKESTNSDGMEKMTQCPWHERCKEQDIDFDTCGVPFPSIALGKALQ